jgi:hypothetical protein
MGVRSPASSLAGSDCQTARSFGARRRRSIMPLEPWLVLPARRTGAVSS